MDIDHQIKNEKKKSKMKCLIFLLKTTAALRKPDATPVME